MTENLLSELHFEHSRDMDNISYNDVKNLVAPGSQASTLSQHGV